MGGFGGGPSRRWRVPCGSVWLLRFFPKSAARPNFFPALDFSNRVPPLLPLCRTPPRRHLSTSPPPRRHLSASPPTAAAPSHDFRACAATWISSVVVASSHRQGLDYLVISGLSNEYLFKLEGERKVLRQLVSLYKEDSGASLPDGVSPIDIAALIKCYSLRSLLNDAVDFYLNV
ncbi:hypothetical protein GUJ93_ZPchr0001g32025 [Zizania palustris]|uniref:Uncharacterized protein n=1 Tax=Zizania palustris TaxID=103762 RepID=A0A8J5RLM0_ZIZPA|nr:hypothetical protein GUJ93_ZPchr0001g32025 [Zizania palustris]